MEDKDIAIYVLIFVIMAIVIYLYNGGKLVLRNEPMYALRNQRMAGIVKI